MWRSISVTCLQGGLVVMAVGVALSALRRAARWLAEAAARTFCVRLQVRPDVCQFRSPCRT